MILMVASSATSFADIYMRVDGVEGESLHSDYRDWIEIDSYVLEMSLPGLMEVTEKTGGRLNKEKKPLIITKMLDKSTPLLFGKLVNGEMISNIDIEVVRNDSDMKNVALKIRLENAMIINASTEAINEGDIMKDQFSIIYENIIMEYPSEGVMFEDTDY